MTLEKFDPSDPVAAQILNRAPLPTFTHYQDENGLYCIDIPGTSGGGNQRFMATDLAGLCSKLASSVHYGTAHIRRLTHLLKGSTDAEEEAEARFRRRQAAGEFNDDL